MKIIVAKTAGFCMGVRRAVDLAIDRSRGSSNELLTLGPLIHNSQTIDMLRKHGVQTYDETRPLEKPTTLLIRAHGVPPEKQAKYETEGHEIIDGTCPKVKTVHRVIQKYKAQDYSIIIAGDQGHAEVVGLQTYAAEAGHLVQTPEDIDDLPELDKVCLVSQTTFDRETFDAIASAVRKRFDSSEIAVKKTICSATSQRQSETK